MIDCDPTTTLALDPRVIDCLQQPDSNVFGKKVTFDADYLAALPQFHAGTPNKPFFTDSTGVVRRIGWFVGMVDDVSPLPEPFQPGTYFTECDARWGDRALPGLLSDEVCPFHFGERIFPFAALFTDGEAPDSLRLYSFDVFPSDSLCFDRSTTPHSVVYCNGEAASLEADRWEDAGGETEFDYGFIIPVARSFVEFCTLLQASP